ncbi:hypothetical protein D3C72_968410 [compost metagenome]
MPGMVKVGASRRPIRERAIVIAPPVPWALIVQRAKASKGGSRRPASWTLPLGAQSVTAGAMIGADCGRGQ